MNGVFMKNYIDLRKREELDTTTTPNICEENHIHEMSCCPLCHAKEFLVTGRMDINYLIDAWTKKRKFNPIPTVYINKKLEQRLCKNCELTYYNFVLKDSTKLYDLLAKQNYYPAFRPEFAFVIDFLKQKNINSLLEVGCGGGGFLDKIQHYVGYALGSEYSDTAIRICKTKNLNVTKEKLEDIHKTFDVVCNFEVAEHVVDIQDFIQTCLNKVRKNGYLIISTPNPDGVLSFIGDGILDLPPHHQHILSKRTFQYLGKLFHLKMIKYFESNLTYHEYETYVEHVTQKPLTTNDMNGFLLTSKKLKGHSHVVIFKKRNK